MSDSSSTEPLPVTAVIVARDRGAVIGRCPTSVFRANPHAAIVVDGCSTDDTTLIAEAHGAVVVSD